MSVIQNRIIIPILILLVVVVMTIPIITIIIVIIFVIIIIIILQQTVTTVDLCSSDGMDKASLRRAKERRALQVYAKLPLE